MTKRNDILAAAIAFYENGVAVVPVRPDGSKAPVVEWKALYKEQGPDFDQLLDWFDTPRYGLGVICGAISDGLEMAEIEGRAIERLAEVRATAEASGLAELLARVEGGYVEQSPSGGLHWLYRVAWTEQRPAEGSTRLANGPRDALGRLGPVYAETRGHGGFAVAAPTPAEMWRDKVTGLPNGRGWTAQVGSPRTIPTLTPVERDALLELLRTLDEGGARPRAERGVQEAISRNDLDETKPGDDFELRVTWAEILRDGLVGEDGAQLIPAYGWEVVESLYGGDAEDDDEARMWRHPTATNDQSASTGYADDRNRLYVFSSSTDFEPETPYTKFGAYATLVHGGDFHEAAQALAEAGYGERSGSWAQMLTEGVSEPVVATATVAQTVEPAAVTPLTPVELPRTDMGLAARIVRQEGRELRYVADGEKWFVWDGKRWRRDGTAEHARRAMGVVANLVPFEGTIYDTTPTGNNGDGPSEFDQFQKWAMQQQSEARIRAAIKLTGHSKGIAVAADHFDAKLALLSFENGTLDLDTLELRPHDPADHLTKLVDYDYDPQAEAPTWERFIRQVLPDPEDRAFMQRAAGYSLTGQNNERAMFLLFGPAATGKSKFLDALGYAVGEYAHTASAATFMAKRNEDDGPNPGLRALEGPRLVFMSESNRSQAWNEALIKRITGGDQITTRTLYTENTTFKPTGTLWLATNAKPSVNGDDGAIYTRMMMMPFLQQIEEKDQDRHLSDKLKSERAGIMRWMIEGLIEYREIGLKPSQNAIDALDAYKVEQDNVAQFLNDCVTPGHKQNDFASIKRLYDAYADYCAAESYLPLGKKRFGQRLEALGHMKGKRREGGQPDAGDTAGPVWGFYGFVVDYEPQGARRHPGSWG